MNKTTTLKKELKSPKKTESELNQMNEAFIPSQYVIDNILNYSKALSIRKSKHLNFIETILN